MNNQDAIIARGLERIADIVGAENFFRESGDVTRRSKDTLPSTQFPVAYAYPENVSQIRSILSIANQCRIPVWPCSKGRNWGYGAATAVAGGSLILVLERMNRILKVDSDLAYAVIEPGVTYRQLNAYLKENRIKLWCDTTDSTPEGSVLGNALDRGIGATPYGDHFGKICGLEAVLPTGEIFQTGGGPLDNAQTWNTHKWGTGPYLEGLFTQSNFGIVTKGGIWLMPEPECVRSFSFELNGDRDLGPVIDAVRRLSLNGAVQTQLHMVNEIASIAVIGDPSHPALNARRMAPETVAQLIKKYRVAPWSFFGAVYGTAAQVRANRALIEKELAAYGTVRFMSDGLIGVIERLLAVIRRLEPKKTLHRFAASLARLVFKKPLSALRLLSPLHGLLKGIPTEEFLKHAYFKTGRPKPDSDVDPARDDCGIIWFAPIVPLTGRHVKDLIALAEPLYRKFGFDFYLALMLMNPRAVIGLFGVFYRKNDPEEAKLAHELYKALCHATENAGVQQYRTSVAFMPHLPRQAAEFHRFAERLKRAVDPNNVLAPGKYGLGISAEGKSRLSEIGDVYVDTRS